MLLSDGTIEFECKGAIFHAWRVGMKRGLMQNIKNWRISPLTMGTVTQEHILAARRYWPLVHYRITKGN